MKAALPKRLDFNPTKRFILTFSIFDESLEPGTLKLLPRSPTPEAFLAIFSPDKNNDPGYMECCSEAGALKKPALILQAEVLR